MSITILGGGDSGRDVYRKRRNSRRVMLDVFNLNYLEQCSLKFNAHIMHLGIWLKCGFWFSDLGWASRVCTSNKLPGDAEVAGLWEDICVKEFWLLKYLVQKIRSCMTVISTNANRGLFLTLTTQLNCKNNSTFSFVIYFKKELSYLETLWTLYVLLYF